mmetsp:Transcript_46224/g.46905  ORF Transcript_46224/g.46905 Transcript_46224/m.46905 type:complete len:106 (+) Transcript_46224:330-647(+)
MGGGGEGEAVSVTTTHLPAPQPVTMPTPTTTTTMMMTVNNNNHNNNSFVEQPSYGDDSRSMISSLLYINTLQSVNKHTFQELTVMDPIDQVCCVTSRHVTSRNVT